MTLLLRSLPTVATQVGLRQPASALAPIRKTAGGKIRPTCIAPASIPHGRGLATVPWRSSAPTAAVTTAYPFASLIRSSAPVGRVTGVRREFGARSDRRRSIREREEGSILAKRAAKHAAKRRRPTRPNRGDRERRSNAAGANDRRDEGGLAARSTDIPGAAKQLTKGPPPALLHRTASPHVYVASIAASDMGVDPASLFARCHDGAGGNVPKSFRGSRFEYVSPKALKGGERLPRYRIPEVALLGRSNAGKSSLINALTGRRSLARVSKTPGRTQQVNYFAIVKSGRFNATATDGGESAFHPADATGFVIDLPGYGFAAAPKDIVRDWQRDTQDFLLSRRDSGNLMRVYLLIDARRGMGRRDLDVMRWFDNAGIPYCITLTKADRVGMAALVLRANEVCTRYHLSADVVQQGPLVHITSSEKKEGVMELKWSIESDFNLWKKRNNKERTGWGLMPRYDSGEEEYLLGDDYNEEGEESIKHAEDVGYEDAREVVEPYSD